MVQVSSCPEPERWRQMLLGQYPEVDAVALEAHLACCDTCLRTIRSVQAEDTLIEAMRSQETPPALELSETVRKLIERAKHLQQEGTSAKGTWGATHSPDAAPSGGIPANPPWSPLPVESLEELFDFLAPPEGPGELGRLAGYRLLGLLGRGGMGIVFEAEDIHLQRRVALKVMCPRANHTSSARQRFLREARAMAAVEHDHIVPIFQVGEDRGVPFLAMPLLQGGTLETLLAKGTALSIPQVVRIGRQIAEGLAAAHDSRLIHRDVKPSNVWIEKVHGGRVKLLDFGLARLATEEQALTQSGTVVGTPSYMAPEQARGLSIDGRADLFGLGCVLYRMTTGSLPFTGPDTFAILTALATETPAAPSTINPAVPAALSSLIMRLLEKDPTQRPASAHDVAAALDSMPLAGVCPFQETAAQQPDVSLDQTTAVHTPPRQRRFRVAMLVAVAVLLVGGTTLLAPVIVRLASSNGELVVEVDDPAMEVVVKQDGAVLHDRVKQREFHLRTGKGEVEFYDPDTGVKLATKAFRIHRGGKEVVRATVRELAQPKPLAPALTIPAASPLDGLRRQDIPADELALAGGGDPAKAPPELVSVLGSGRLRHGGSVSAMRFSDDGKYLLSARLEDFTIRLWDVSTGRQVEAATWPEWTVVGLTLRGAETPRIATVPFGNGRPSGNVKKLRSILFFGPELRSEVSWIPGKSFRHDTLVRFDLEAGKEETLLQREGHELMNTALSPDGTLIALAWRDYISYPGEAVGKQEVFDMGTRQVRHTLRLPRGISADTVAFTPDGKQVVSGCADGKARFSGAHDGKELRTLKAEGQIARLAFSPDGKRLATVGNGSHVHLWDLTSGKVIHTLPLISGGGYGQPQLAFSPDGTMLAAASCCGAIQLFDTATGRERRVDDAPRSFAGMAISQDGRTLAAAATEGPVTLYNLATGRRTSTVRLGEQPFWSVSRMWLRPVALHPNGKTLAATWPPETVMLLDVESAKVRGSLTPSTRSWGVAFSPDGKQVADFNVSSCWVAVWGEQGEKPLWSRHSDQGNQYGFTYTPDGRSLAIFGRSPGDGKDAWVQVLDAATGKPGRLFVAPGQGRESASSIAFSPDGHLLAVSSGRNAMGMNVLVWDVATGEERFQLKSGQDSTVGVAFHPDGKILASIGLDGNVCLWNLAAPAGQSRLVQTIRVGLPSHNMWQVAFAPDGRHLLVLTGNGTINVLRLALPATKGNR